MTAYLRKNSHTRRFTQTTAPRLRRGADLHASPQPVLDHLTRRCPVPVPPHPALPTAGEHQPASCPCADVFSGHVIYTGPTACDLRCVPWCVTCFRLITWLRVSGLLPLLSTGCPVVHRPPCTVRPWTLGLCPHLGCSEGSAVRVSAGDFVWTDVFISGDTAFIFM